MTRKIFLSFIRLSPPNPLTWKTLNMFHNGFQQTVEKMRKKKITYFRISAENDQNRLQTKWKARRRAVRTVHSRKLTRFRHSWFPLWRVMSVKLTHGSFVPGKQQAPGGHTQSCRKARERDRPVPGEVRCSQPPWQHSARDAEHARRLQHSRSTVSIARATRLFVTETLHW